MKKEIDFGKRLAIGCLRLPVISDAVYRDGFFRDDSNVDEELFTKIVDKAMANGYNSDASIASWAYRWVASLPGVRVVAAGMPKIEFLEDNMKTFDNFVPLNEEEYKIIDQVTEIINAKTAIACTNCKYCEEKCPKHIPAGDYFGLYNEWKRQSESSSYNDVNTSALTYGNWIEHRPSAAECIECKQCEKVCPQHLPVAKLLKEKIDGELWSCNPESMLAAKVDKM